jgi:hypothetical protein
MPGLAGQIPNYRGVKIVTGACRRFRVVRHRLRSECRFTGRGRWRAKGGRGSRWNDNQSSTVSRWWLVQLLFHRSRPQSLGGGLESKGAGRERLTSNVARRSILNAGSAAGNRPEGPLRPQRVPPQGCRQSVFLRLLPRAEYRSPRASRSRAAGLRKVGLRRC